MSVLQSIRLCLIMLGLCGSFAIARLALADTTEIIPMGQSAEQINENTIGVVFTHEELFHQAVHNMEDELEPNGGLRIVPIMGKNHVQSIYDLLYLKGVDLALVRADAIEYVKRHDNNLPIQSLVQNITRISDEKIVILARNSIKTLDDLNGKSIALGLAGSGEFVTGSLVLETLGIEAKTTLLDNVSAAQRLRSGELDAMVYLLRAPDAVLSVVDDDAAKHVRNLKTIDDVHALAMPRRDELAEIYTASELTHDELPGVIDAGATVDTYSVDAILAAYKWPADNPRFQRVERFIAALAASLDGLKSGPYEPFWDRVSLDAQTPNVVRLSQVDTVLAARERLAEESRIAAIERKKARAEARKAARVAELTEQRNVISQKLGEKLGTADTQELEALLEELGAFMDKLETDTTTATNE